MGDVSPNDRQGTSEEPVRSRFFGRRAPLRSPADALQPEAAPPPPAKKVKVRKRSLISTISGVFTFLVFLAVAAVGAVIIGSQRLQVTGPLKADAIVVIPPRTDVPDILARLENEGIIDSQLLMNIALFAEGTRSKLKAGEYNFKQGASIQDVIDTLVGGHSVLHSFTIPEGWTSEQILGRLREQELLESDVREQPKEGSLMPDTYKFARGETRDKQVQKMMEAQKKLLAEIWSRRAADLPLKSPFELVTLASIVERETGKADERPRVAGVFVNRITRGMPLQSDPTIVYGLVGGKGSLGHPITREELTKQTPYNTYQIRGLPPGPIGNPGRAAMEAVANPSRTQELFFVADGTGGHVFAETLDQHNKNVARWRQIERDAKDRLAPDAEKQVAPAKSPDQKGELDALPGLPVTLPTAFAAHEAPGGEAAEALARLASAMGSRAAPRPSARVAEWKVPLAKAGPKGTAGAPLNFGNFDPLRVAGVSDETALEEGEVSPDLTAYPVSSSRRADQKLRAARFGLTSAADTFPPEPEPPVQPVAPAAGALARPRAFDASEGTGLDPLRNKSFDLTSAKTVPSFK